MSNTAGQLAYYQKNAEEAFMEGFTTRIHYECIDSEVYEVHKYYLPILASKKVKWVRRYFKTLHEQDIEITYKRRKHWVEYAETAFMMLGRIYHLCGKGYQIRAGSQHVSPVSWAIFGEGDPGCMARHQFSNVLEIANHYRNLLHGKCYPIELHFKIGHSHWGPRLAQKFKKAPLASANFWMAVALLLTYDIIHECGPDCSEFFELFSNDYRETPENFDAMGWEQLRCTILGVPGRVDVNKIPHGRGKIRHIAPLSKKPFKAKIEIDLLSDSNDLAAGEKTYPTLITVEERDSQPGACCPLPPTPHDMWPEDLGMHVGVHGIGLRRLGVPHIHDRFRCKPLSREVP